MTGTIFITFVSRVDIVPPTGGGDFKVGIATEGSEPQDAWAVDLSFDTTYRLVVAYDIDNGQSKLWIDPSVEGDTNIVGSSGASTSSVTAVAFREGNSSEDETIDIDNLVVGTAFADVSGAGGEMLTVLLSPTSVQEDAGTGQVNVTVTRTGSTTGALDVTLVSSDLSEATIPVASGQIPDGVDFKEFMAVIDIVDDSLVDGAQDVTISASATGFSSGIATLTVTDDGDSYPDIVINEVWSNDFAADTAEYVELFGPAGAPLFGLSLIVVDGDTAGVMTSGNYRQVTVQIDFTGEVIPADGFFVIGKGTAPNVDMTLADDLQNETQTYALVPTADIAYDAVDMDELTQASVEAITASLLDAIAVIDSGAGDHVYFGAPALGSPVPDLFARTGDGVDTDAAADWSIQNNSSLELGDSGDTLSSVGTSNNAGSASAAKITGISVNVGTSTVTLTFKGDPGYAYTLKGSENLDSFFLVATSPGATTPDVNGNGSVEFDYSPGTYFFRLEN